MIAIWENLLWPLCRLLLGLGAGLFIASILESLKWTEQLARVAWPLSRMARLQSGVASAFALAAVSPAAANAFLAELHEQGKLTTRDLVLSNLFNSLPANLVHLPTIFFLTWPVLGKAAVIYVGISFGAAVGRTIFTICLSRWLHPREAAFPEKKGHDILAGEENFPARFKNSLSTAIRRFRKRMPRLIYFTVPFYIIIYYTSQAGLFAMLENWLAQHLSWLAIVKPQAMSVVILQMVAELGASLGAAGALLETGSLDARDVVVAMLAGNILSTPLRAIRHQFPAYAGFYTPFLAFKLVIANQLLRAASMAIALFIYVII